MLQGFGAVFRPWIYKCYQLSVNVNNLQAIIACIKWTWPHETGHLSTIRWPSDKPIAHHWRWNVMKVSWSWKLYSQWKVGFSQKFSSWIVFIDKSRYTDLHKIYTHLHEKSIKILGLNEKYFSIINYHSKLSVIWPPFIHTQIIWNGIWIIFKQIKIEKDQNVLKEQSDILIKQLIGQVLSHIYTFIFSYLNNLIYLNTF